MPPERKDRSQGKERRSGHQFKIRVVNPTQLFDAMQSGASGQIGKQLLEKPLTEVEVSAMSTGGNFDLVAEISPDFDWKQKGSGTRESFLLQTLAEYKKKERGGLYILTTEHGAQFVVGKKKSMGDDFFISTGPVAGYLDDVTNVIASPKLTRKTYDTVLEDFNALVVHMVDAMYATTGKTSPDEELVLNLPQTKGLMRYVERQSELTDDLMGKITVERPNVKFDDIGGQAEAKKVIQGLAYALTNPGLYAKWGTRPPKGILLWGPQGTGKTLLVKALASEASAKFLHVQAPDLGSKWYGESEKIVQAIFRYAQQNSEKTIIFFDEIDAIAPNRTGAHEATQRLVATLLVNMDGLISNPNLIVVGSTNRKDSIDPALTRAGRFDKWVEVPLPDEQGLSEILKIHMTRADEIAHKNLFNRINLNELARSARGLNGADMAEIIRRTLEEKVRIHGTTGIAPGKVSREELLSQITSYKEKH